jgi:hypothetical protein
VLNDEICKGHSTGYVHPAVFLLLTGPEYNLKSADCCSYPKIFAFFLGRGLEIHAEYYIIAVMISLNFMRC